MSAGSAKTPSGILGPTFGTASRPEPPARSAVVLSFFAILVMALSLGPSFAHLLEAPPRLTAWPPELWREASALPWPVRLLRHRRRAARRGGDRPRRDRDRRGSPPPSGLPAGDGRDHSVHGEPGHLDLDGRAGERDSGAVGAGADSGRLRSRARSMGSRPHRDQRDQGRRSVLRTRRWPVARPLARDGGGPWKSRASCALMRGGVTARAAASSVGEQGVPDRRS